MSALSMSALSMSASSIELFHFQACISQKTNDAEMV